MREIRRIRVGEWELYRELRLRALRDAPYAFASTYQEALEQEGAFWVEQVEKASGGGERCILLAWAESSAVGMAAVWRSQGNREEADVCQVWLEAPYRGSGLAEGLMEAVFDWCRAHEVARVYAGITQGNERAMRFYQKIGFRRDESRCGESACAAYFVRQIGY